MDAELEILQIEAAEAVTAANLAWIEWKKAQKVMAVAQEKICALIASRNKAAMSRGLSPTPTSV